MTSYFSSKKKIDLMLGLSNLPRRFCPALSVCSCSTLPPPLLSSSGRSLTVVDILAPTAKAKGKLRRGGREGGLRVLRSPKKRGDLKAELSTDEK